MIFENLTEEQKKVAVDYGYMGIFGERETVREAHYYSVDLAKACGEEAPGAMTAVQVLANTFAVQMAAMHDGSRAVDEPRSKSANKSKNEAVTSENYKGLPLDYIYCHDCHLIINQDVSRKTLIEYAEKHVSETGHTVFIGQKIWAKKT